MGADDAAKFTLYTNHRCPWAHRVHIVLAELGLPFDEVIIDLDRPRDPEYLALNSRGLVPTLSLARGDGAANVVLAESAVVAQFLADAHPSHLAPLTGSVEGALARARVAFFVDAYFSKWQGRLMKLSAAVGDEAVGKVVDEALEGLVGEVEPLLAGAAPFFGGSARLTMAEVLTGSFALRTVSFCKTDIYPDALKTAIPERAPNFWKWAQEVAAHPSVRGIFDEGKVVASTKTRMAKVRAAALA